MKNEQRASRILGILVENHDRFLRFLLPRVGTREAAEDVLQAAFVKTLERGEGVRQDQSAVAWFYKVLRNALADHFRRHAVDQRAMKSIAKEPTAGPQDAGLEKAVCQCVKEIIPTLKSEYADILQKVEMEGTPVTDLARNEKITPNNAMVRLHRARKALHGRLIETCGTCTEHGCLDCRCKGQRETP